MSKSREGENIGVRWGKRKDSERCHEACSIVHYMISPCHCFIFRRGTPRKPFATTRLKETLKSWHNCHTLRTSCLEFRRAHPSHAEPVREHEGIISPLFFWFCRYQWDEWVSVARSFFINSFVATIAHNQNNPDVQTRHFWHANDFQCIWKKMAGFVFNYCSPIIAHSRIYFSLLIPFTIFITRHENRNICLYLWPWLFSPKSLRWSHMTLACWIFFMGKKSFVGQHGKKFSHDLLDQTQFYLGNGADIPPNRAWNVTKDIMPCTIQGKQENYLNN